jgi:hypothetical protein
VLAPDGRPAIGARIGLVTDDPEPLRLGGVFSDGDGNYRLEGLVPGRVVVEATHDDYVRTVKDLAARAGMNRLDLQFEGGQEVSGTVTDASGTMLVGAIVRLAAPGREWGGPEARTAVDGSFKMVGVGDGDYKIVASREGYAASDGEVAVHVAGKPVQGLRVTLGTGAAIVGTVSGVDPEKLSQVEIRASSPSRGTDASATADREGGYRLEGLLPGTWAVSASLPGTGRQARSQVVLDPGASEARLDLQFGEGLTLSGRALQGEAPVKGAVLFAQGTSVNSSSWGRTGADGAFRMEGLEPGTYRVELRQWETGLYYDETVELPSSREITMSIPTARVAGRIVDGADRRPMAGVQVSLAPVSSGSAGSGDDRPRAAFARAATTDMNGRFELASVTDGGWTLTANKTGYAAGTLEVTVQGGHDVNDAQIALDATEGVTIDVRLPSGRIPDTVAAAVLDPSGRPVTGGSYATGENGRIRLSSVPPGSWDLVVSAGGSGTLNLRVNVPGPAVAAALPPACTLKVTVPDLAGTSVAGTVTIQGQDGRSFRSLGWMADSTSRFRLAAGRIELDTLPPGAWTARVEASDGRTWSGNASTQPGTPAELVLR